jgi:hypothetical protein
VNAPDATRSRRGSSGVALRKDSRPVFRWPSFQRHTRRADGEDGRAERVIDPPSRATANQGRVRGVPRCPRERPPLASAPGTWECGLGMPPTGTATPTGGTVVAMAESGTSFDPCPVNVRARSQRCGHRFCSCSPMSTCSAPTDPTSQPISKPVRPAGSPSTSHSFSEPRPMSSSPASWCSARSSCPRESTDPPTSRSVSPSRSFAGAVGESSYYFLGSGIELALLATVVYYAWTWPRRPNTSQRSSTAR